MISPTECPIDVCPHCGTVPPPGASTRPYCCHGCEVAHGLLSSVGLTRYYALRGDQGVPVGESAAPDKEPLWLGGQLTRARAQVRAGGPLLLSLDVQGIHCAACVWVMERLFYRHPGASRIVVNPTLGRLELVFHDGTFPLVLFLGELAQLGYRTGPAHKTADARSDDLFMRFGVTAAIAMNSMVLSAAGYFGMNPVEDRGLFEAFAWANQGLAVLALWVGGSLFIRSAWAALKRGVLHLDVPIALGVVLAFAGSCLSFYLTPDHTAWFDTLNIFIALMLLGRLLQRRVVARNRQMLLEDDGVDGLFVRRLTQGELRVVPAASLRAGEEIVVSPGEVVPARAELVAEAGSFALDWINGEPEPTSFAQGEVVPAGAMNASRVAVHLRAQEDFASSRLRDLLQVPEDRDPASDFWHPFSTIYVALVLLLGAAALVMWWPAGLAQAVSVTVAVLVVTCPCALGLAIPLAGELAQARLRRSGMFIRRASFLDRAVQVQKVVFDKTGTLTLSEPVLADPGPLRALSGASRVALWQMVSRSNHPRSRALSHALTREGAGGELAFDPGADVEEEAGQGLSLRQEGHLWRLGRPSFALGADHTGDPGLPEGRLVFSCDGERQADFQFREALQHDAFAEVARLGEMGIEVYLLSGDAPARVCEMAQRLGVEPQRAVGGMSPEQKEAFVRSLDRRNTLMIGDGVNDALALEAAWCAGTPAVDRPTLPGRADFYFVGRGVGPIAQALGMARRVRRVVLNNLVLAVAYNVLAVGLSLAGYMTPLLAALAMPASSIVIVLATVAAMRREDPRQVVAPGRAALEVA